MQRWMWAAATAAVLTVTATGVLRPSPTEATPRGKGVLALDFSKVIRGRVVSVRETTSTCEIANSDATITKRTTDVRRIRIEALVRPGHCDETPSTGGLDGTFEADLSGIEKRSDSGGDVPLRPAADQPVKDNRGAFSGKWQIRNANGAVVARGDITLLLHVNSHVPPAIPNAATDECYVPGQIEGILLGSASVGDMKGCRVSASFSGTTTESGGGVDLIADAEGLLACPCDERGRRH